MVMAENFLASRPRCRRARRAPDPASSRRAPVGLCVCLEVGGDVPRLLQCTPEHPAQCVWGHATSRDLTPARVQPICSQAPRLAATTTPPAARAPRRGREPPSASRPWAPDWCPGHRPPARAPQVWHVDRSRILLGVSAARTSALPLPLLGLHVGEPSRTPAARFSTSADVPTWCASSTKKETGERRATSSSARRAFRARRRASPSASGTSCRGADGEAPSSTRPDHGPLR